VGLFLNEYTGRGVRIAVLDSGVHAAHPHVQGVEQGIAIREDGSLDDDFVDTLGHGTAVAAAIREKAPDALLAVIKVFWRTLSTDVGCLVRGIDEACVRGERPTPRIVRCSRRPSSGPPGMARILSQRANTPASHGCRERLPASSR
jgi:hypothetical protein